MKLSRIALFIIISLLPTAARAGDRYVNQARLEQKKIHMIESVQVLDAQPAEGSYDLIQTIRGSDVFTEHQDQIINLIRYEAAKSKANAIMDVRCKVEYKYMRTCSAKAIRLH